MICPRCGAENQPTAKLCRMCATPLDTVTPTVVSPPKQNMYPPVPAGISAGPLRDNKPVVPSAVPSPGPSEILCATCKAVNDITWAYCQQCGSQLQKPAPPQVPVIVPSPPVPPAPTVQSPPQIVSPAPIPPPVVPKAPPVPTTTPRRDEVASHVLTCVSCGRINTPGSSFCATCGAPLPVDHTLQMRPVSSTPRLRLIQEGGGEGEIYKLEVEETVIGRNNGDIRFPHDGYMSGRHARIIKRGERFVLIDENSRNGTFKRIDGEVELKSGDIVLIGKQLFRFEL